MSTSGQKRIESTIDTAIDCDEDEVMELAMQAGELLLENGAEIFRGGRNHGSHLQTLRC